MLLLISSAIRAGWRGRARCSGAALLVLGILSLIPWQMKAWAQQGSVALNVGALYIGKPLPAWNLKQWVNTKRPVTLASLKGKYALVQIFRTQCPHCNDAVPFMIALNSRYDATRLSVVGIQSPGNFKDSANPENDWEAVRNWVAGRKIRYPIGFDVKSGYFQGTIENQLLQGKGNALLYPTTLLLDRNGTVVFALTGHDTEKAINLAVEIEKRLPSLKSVKGRAHSLAKWLITNLPDLDNSTSSTKALSHDIEQRLTMKKSR